MVKQKSLEDYIKEDPSLVEEKLTYDEIKRRENMTANIDDSPVAEGFKIYQEMLKEEKEGNVNGSD